MLSLFKKELPCQKEHCLKEGEVPRCMQVRDAGEVLTCPVSIKLRDSINDIEHHTQRGGYSYLAWVVLKGPSCELVCFQNEPCENDLKELYGEELIAVVPF